MTVPPRERAALASLREPGVTPGQVRRAVDALLQEDPAVAIAAVFDLLATPPRIKPSRRLLIDPRDEARRRWDCRVAATAALLGSPHAVRVVHELRDELAADGDLRADVMAVVTPHPSVRDVL